MKLVVFVGLSFTFFTRSTNNVIHTTNTHIYTNIHTHTHARTHDLHNTNIHQCEKLQASIAGSFSSMKSGFQKNICSCMGCCDTDPVCEFPLTVAQIPK